MSNTSQSIPSDGMPTVPNTALPQNDLNQTQISSPSEGGPAASTTGAQTGSDMKVQARKQVSPTQILNLSRANRPAVKAGPVQPQPTDNRGAVPIPNMEILSIDDELGIQTELEKARDKFLDLIESLKTGRYLTGTIQGVEKHSGMGEPRAIIFHGDYKVVIMASMVVNLPRSLRDQEPNDIYHYLLTKRIGAEIDFVIKGIDQNTGLAVASRKEAMNTKRRYYYLNLTRDGTYRIYEGVVCEARVTCVIPDGIFVEIFGVDVYIPLRELSYVRLSDAMGYFEPGDRVLVKITHLDRSDPNNIRISASVKQVASNPLAKALEKIEVESNYAGTVSMADENGIFVQLDMGAECRCPYPHRTRPPKGARVIVKIAGVDLDKQYIWGSINYVTLPK